MPITAILNAKTLATPISHDGSPKTGEEMSQIRIVEDAGVLIENQRIVFAGPTRDLLASFDIPKGSITIDATGMTILPGFVDSHTHLVFAGSRENEFKMRLQGASYMEILNAGGGILSTVKSTRSASAGELYLQTRTRLERMLSHGTTTAEAKTGYGLELETEMKCLRVLEKLNREHAVDIIPTFLGAHAFPPEYASRDEYVDVVVERMLPEVASSGLAKYCDVFCEEGVFGIEDSRKILSRARELGMLLRIHADEMKYTGASMLAVEMGAASADHMVATPEHVMEAMAKSRTPAILLPGTPFVLMNHKYPDARKMIEKGVPVAVATDLNPNCYTESLQMAASLACYEMKMVPEEVLTAITLNPAYSLGLSKDRGSIEEGKRGDLTIMDVPNHKHLGYHPGVNMVSAVVKNGEIAYKK